MILIFGFAIRFLPHFNRRWILVISAFAKNRRSKFKRSIKIFDSGMSPMKLSFKYVNLTENFSLRWNLQTIFFLIRFHEKKKFDAHRSRILKELPKKIHWQEVYPISKQLPNEISKCFIHTCAWFLCSNSKAS